MEDKDLEIENILNNNLPKKKKVDGKAKGDRGERNLCKKLTKHFGTEFSKALGSGSRWSQVGYLPEHARKTLIGDICAPEDFLWVLECKNGYEEDIDLGHILDRNVGFARLDEFIEQVSRDAEYCGRKPMVLWKRNNRPWLAMLKSNDFYTLKISGSLPYQIQYRDWVIINFEALLQCTSKGFWFKVDKHV